MDGKSLNITQERIAQLKSLFPEVFAEDKIDFEKLKNVLGADTLAPEERYELNWAGKYEAFKEVQKQTTATLIPDLDSSIDFENSQNLFIEGENLEVLRILQKSYHNQVKMIYIDPPYNTGNDSFVYPDDYTERRNEYEARTGITDDEGYLNKQDLWKKNSKENGQFHSVWLSMMYPRLYMARNLLREDGVIFVSIDDNEVGNLRLLMDSVFGGDNFLSSIVWEKRFTRSNNTKTFATLTETLLCYRKSSRLEYIREPRSEKADSTYSNPDNDLRGVWTSVSYVNPATKAQRPNLVYPIINPNNKQEINHPTNAWKYEKDVYVQHVKENRLYWGKEGDNKYPRLKKFLSEMGDEMVAVNFWNRKDTGTTDEGSKELEKLLGGKYFDFPKPHSLIKRVISHSGSDDDIYLDFFAGSCPTAHAIFSLNKQDRGKRKFIQIQLPELTDKKSEAYKAGYKNIAEIGKERLRRVINNIEIEKQTLQKELQSKEAVLTELEAEKAKTPELFKSSQSKRLTDLETQIKELKTQIANIESNDLGFKSFKLAPSNFKIWRNDATGEDLVKQLEAFQQPYREGAVTQNMLYEILLKAGRSLTVSIQPISIGEHTLYNIEDGSLMIALDAINTAIIDKVLELKPRTFITLDKLFHNDSQLLTNTRLQFREQDIDFQVI